LKVVINNCYGGFSLSNAALVELRKRKSLGTYFYKMNYSNGYRDVAYIKTDENEESLFVSVSSKDCGEYTDKIEYLSDRDFKRNDPELIQLIEDWGTEKVSGKFAQLKVVEIPDDAEWEIEEYDGSEWVSEVHRTWS
jgi:hypothetical protein